MSQSATGHSHCFASRTPLINKQNANLPEYPITSTEKRGVVPATGHGKPLALFWRVAMPPITSSGVSSYGDSILFIQPPNPTKRNPAASDVKAIPPARSNNKKTLHVYHTIDLLAHRPINRPVRPALRKPSQQLRRKQTPKLNVKNERGLSQRKGERKHDEVDSQVDSSRP
jgi:hypothetical protein